MRAARAASLALATGGLLAGCATGTTLIAQPPLCEAGDDGAGEGVILMAQSVPTSAFVPCIGEALPLGWGFHHLDARNGAAVFSLDSDRDGQQAVEVRLAESCDTSGSTEIPSDREDMRRLERVERLSPGYAGERFYLFEGGCLTFRFRLAGEAPGEALALASSVVDVLPRADLEEQVREESGGRLSLDPEEGT